MQQQDDRSFSRTQYQSGRWHTVTPRLSHPLQRWLLECISFKHAELDRFTRRCIPEAIVVDLGAGIGSYARFFLRRLPATVIAIDWSPEALQKIPSAPQGTLLKICADAHRLPLKPMCIDALYTIDTLGHLRHQEQVLDEITRICRSGAPLFIHSECSDYRTRWPDRMLIKRTGTDRIAELDGHFAIRPCAAMQILYEQRFVISRFYSPAGILGWLTGYPDKYLKPLWESRAWLPALAAALFSVIKKIPLCRYFLRLLNTGSNRLELFLGLQGGGSCFAQGHTLQRDAHASEIRLPAMDILIPTYNRPALPGPLIEALTGQLREDDRLFIVWQGDQQPDITVEDRRIISLHQPHPNLPVARNVLLNIGGNPVILYLDDDCRMSEGLLDEHRKVYRDPTIGAVAGFVDDPNAPSGAAVPSQFNPSTGELVQHFALPQSGPSLSVMGANMSYRRTALEKIGGFDTNYRHNALWEEIDVSFRLQHAGYAIRYCSTAKVTHLPASSGGCRQDTSAGHLFHLYANTAYFACCYMPVRHLRTWLRFWKYRLEYLSRRPSSDHSGTSRIRHDPLMIIAGISGVFSGFYRFIAGGRRIGLPAAVVAATPPPDRKVS